MQKSRQFLALSAILLLTVAFLFGGCTQGTDDGGVMPGTINGVVTDNVSGQAIEGAKVSFGVHSTQTASDGSYTLKNLPVGVDQTVIAVKEGYENYQSEKVNLTSGEIRTVDIAMNPVTVDTGTVTGTVTENIPEEAGRVLAPLAGVEVTIGGLTDTTDEDGVYIINGVLQGNQSVTATKEGYQNYSGTVDVVAGGGVDKSFTMAPVPPDSGNITGTVTDYITDIPVVGATVTVGGLSDVTDWDGAYTINGIPAGADQAITATATGYRAYADTVTITAGETLDHGFEMVPYDRVTATDPVDGAVDVPVDQAITVSFQHNIEAGADFADITVNDGTDDIATTNNILDNVLTITPDADLEYDTTYTVTVPAAAVDGVRVMEEDLVFSFTTETLYSQVVSTDPEDEDVNVPVNKVITVNFDIEVTDGLGLNNIIVNDGTDDIDTTNAVLGNVLTIDPVNLLDEGTTYTVTIPGNAVVPPMEDALVFSFSTGNVVLFEDFESWPPSGWTIVDHISSGHVWLNGLGIGRTNLTGGTGDFATADSDYAGSGTTMDTSLITPALDLSGYSNITLEFKSDFRHLLSSQARIDLSTDGGATFPHNLLDWSVSIRGPWTETIDLSDYAGQSNVVIRFRYIASGWYWWWQIDDVIITGTP